MKHTPTPWVADQTVGLHPAVRAEGDPPYAIVSSGFTGPEAWANINFIVKAVNSYARMLWALEFVLENHHEGAGHFEDTIEQVIKEARGES